MRKRTSQSKTNANPSKPLGRSLLPRIWQSMTGARGQPRQNMAFVTGSNPSKVSSLNASCNPEGRRVTQTQAPVSKARRNAAIGRTGRFHRATATRRSTSNKVSYMFIINAKIIIKCEPELVLKLTCANCQRRSLGSGRAWVGIQRNRISSILKSAGQKPLGDHVFRNAIASGAAQTQLKREISAPEG
jgi:hypothetical protein